MAFFQLLGDSETFQQMVNLIKNYERDIFEDSLHQPECIVYMFGSLERQDAIELAHAMKERFGDVILCHESSLHMGEPIALLDQLDEYSADWMINVEDRLIITQAFIDVGFKRARECGASVLRRMFCQHEHYRVHADEVFMYDFDRMKLEREWLRCELAEELHKPCRLQKWMEANPDKDVVEYLDFI